jgi:hypothetical protein
LQNLTKNTRKQISGAEVENIANIVDFMQASHKNFHKSGAQFLKTVTLHIVCSDHCYFFTRLDVKRAIV